MKVPFLNLKKHNHQVFDEIWESVKKTCQESNFILGPQVEEFEKEFARYVGTKYAVAVNSGTAALQLSLLALGVGPADEVITTPYTFFATVETILHCKAKPIFVDIEPETFNLDPGGIERVITNKTRVILPVHLYGQSANMDGINEVAQRHGLSVLEDACQAHGAEYCGQKAGGLGDAGCFSFYPTKNLSGWGEGGIITTNEERVAEYVRKLRNHGSKTRYKHEVAGFNERMDGIQGAVLGVKLKYLDQWNEKRRAYAGFYGRLLSDLPIVLPTEKNYSKHVYYLYTIKTEKRDELQKFLAEKGVLTAIHYPTPLHLQESCSNLGYKKGDLPNAEKASNEVLSLPLYPELEENEIKFVAESVREFFNQKI